MPAWRPDGGTPFDRCEHAQARALELFDLTARDARWRGARRREILRVREEFCRVFYDDEPAPESARGLRAYFLRFAVLARRSGTPGGRV